MSSPGKLRVSITVRIDADSAGNAWGNLQLSEDFRLEPGRVHRARRGPGPVS